MIRDDPIMARLVAEYGELGREVSGDYFAELVGQIIGQQLSVKAAATIRQRVIDLMGGRVVPQSVLAISDEEYRAAGMSNSKTRYIKNIATAVVERTLELDNLQNMSDEEVITQLTQIKGIGRWTAEMFLMFSLGRPDVFSVGDLGLKNAVKRLYGVVTEPEILEVAKKWSPHRSKASLYLWRYLDNAPMK